VCFVVEGMREVILQNFIQTFEFLKLSLVDFWDRLQSTVKIAKDWFLVQLLGKDWLNLLSPFRVLIVGPGNSHRFSRGSSNLLKS